MVHIIIGPVIGAVLYHLYSKHKSRGIDKCTACQEYWQIGTFLKYIPGPGDVETPYCKGCKPEIFP